MSNLLTSWEIDPSHSNISFSVKHLMISKVHGNFQKISGQLNLDREIPVDSSVNAIIETASIQTQDMKRDEHLKGSEFFNVAKYPNIEFNSKKFESVGTEKYKITGKLTMHGITHEVVLDAIIPSKEVKDPWGNVKIGATASTMIKRKDFGLTWNAALEAGGVLVGDDVSIHMDLQLIKFQN